MVVQVVAIVHLVAVPMRVHRCLQHADQAHTGHHLLVMSLKHSS
jgi:hypothetical protein